MEISKIINKIRFKLGDSHEATFSDYDVLQTINENYKQFREICMQEAPTFLTTRREGVVEAGTNVISVSDVAEVIELRIDDKVLRAKRDLPVWEQTGEPKMYAVGLSGNGLSLYLYPTPNVDFEYELICIEQVNDISASGEIDYPNDIVNCIIDLCVSALSGNQEEYLAVDNKLRLILRRYVPLNDFVDGYYRG